MIGPAPPPLPQQVGPCRFDRLGSWITVQCPVRPYDDQGRRGVGPELPPLAVPAGSPRTGAARGATAARRRRMIGPGAPSLQHGPDAAPSA